MRMSLFYVKIIHILIHIIMNYKHVFLQYIVCKSNSYKLYNINIDNKKKQGFAVTTIYVLVDNLFLS